MPTASDLGFAYARRVGRWRWVSVAVASSALFAAVVSPAVVEASSTRPDQATPAVDQDPTWHGGLPVHLDTAVVRHAVAQVLAPDGSTYIVGNGTSGAVVTRLDHAGNPDSTFGGAGTKYLDNPNGVGLQFAGGAAWQPDRGLVVVGAFGNGWKIIRFNPSGAFDSTFAGQGAIDLPAVIGVTFALGVPPTVAVGPDRSLVVAGGATDQAGKLVMVVIRLHADGTVDTNFGTSGTSTVHPPSRVSSFNTPSDTVHVDDLNRPVVSVLKDFGGPFLFRLTASGAFDQNFGAAGFIDVAPTAFTDCWTDFDFDTRGRILTSCPRGWLSNMAGVSRFLDDGSLDATFGDGGTVHVAPISGGAGMSAGHSITMDGDRPVLGGRAADSAAFDTSTDFAVWKFTGDGAPDRSFGSNGGTIRGVDSLPDDAQEVDLSGAGGLQVLISRGTFGITEPSVLRLSPASIQAAPSIALLDAPVRVLDTRIGLPVGAVKLLGGHVLSLPLVGNAGVRADTVAVAMNVTVTEPELAGYVTVYPCGQDPPLASNINFVAGQTIANLVIVRPGSNGAVCLFSSQSTHLVADVTGSYGPGADLRPLAVPLRAVDTRIQLGWQYAAKVGFVPFVVPGLRQSQIPNSKWVGEVFLNVTITEPDHAGYLTAYECGTAKPLASNLNFAAGETISNLVAVRLAPSFDPFAVGERSICLAPSVSTHLVVDIEATVDLGAAEIALPSPVRALDTRSGVGAPTGPITAGVPLELQVAGRPGLSADAIAVGLNVIVTEPSAAGFLTVYPCGQPPPLASNVNFSAGETIPNFVIARVGTQGRVCLISNVSTHVVADLAEYFLPAS